jgi:transposase
MDATVIGIDVPKDRLDVAVRPTGESFIFNRTAARIEDLVARLRALSPNLVAVEATGGFEAVVAAALAGAGLPAAVVNPAQVRAFARSANGPRPLRSMQQCKRRLITAVCFWLKLIGAGWRYGRAGL